MKYAYVAASLIAAVSAQTIADLPSCSLNCVVSAVTGTGCGLTDYACACPKSDALAASVTPCVQKACPSMDDQNKVITVLEGICKGAGHPITISTPAGSSTAVSSTTSTSTSVATASVTISADTSSSSSGAGSTVTSTSSTTEVSVTTTTSSSTASVCGGSSVRTISTSMTTVIPTVIYETVNVTCSTTATKTTATSSTQASVTAGAAANGVALGAGFVAILAMAL